MDNQTSDQTRVSTPALAATALHAPRPTATRRTETRPAEHAVAPTSSEGENVHNADSADNADNAGPLASTSMQTPGSPTSDTVASDASMAVGTEDPACRQIRSDGTEEDCDRSAVWPWMIAGAGVLLAGAAGVGGGHGGDSHAIATAPPSPPSPPAPPAPPAPPPLDPSGPHAPVITITAPGQTKDNTPTVSGTAPAGSQVDVYEGQTKLGIATADASGDWHFTPSQPLADGTHTLTSKVQDAAGNVGSQEATVVVDTVAPTITIEVPTLTNANTPTISGTAPAGSVVDVYEGQAKIGSATADASGDWRFTPTQPLTDGTHALTSKSTDAAGNVGSADTTFVIDTVAPTVMMTAPSLTNDSMPMVSGKAPVGSQVEVYEGAAKLGSATADASGDWNFTPSQPLTEGTHTLTSRVMDAAGNEGQADGTVVIDSVAPAVPTLSLDGDAHGLAPVTASGKVNVSGIEPGASWAYSLDEGHSWTSGEGLFIPQTAFGADGVKELLVKQTDAAGNSATGELTFTLDTAAPDMPTVSSSTGRWLMSADGYVQFGHVEPGAQLTVKLDGKIITPGGTPDHPEFQAYQYGEGTHTVQAYVTDTAGNVSPSTAASYTLDVTSPDAPFLYMSSKRIWSESDHVDVLQLEPGASWWYRVDRSGDWIQGSDPEIPGSAFVTPPGGSGSHVVEAYQVDVAGNHSITTTLALWSQI